MRGFLTSSAKPLLIRAALTVWICVLAGGANAGTTIAAYQEIYNMNFEVADQAGVPAGWFVTFDGYPVAQVRPNHWVYGRTVNPGVLIPTEVAVGSVVPMDVPQLARVALPLLHSGAYDTEQFRSITLSRFDSMGVLDDPFAYTPIAWKKGEAGLRIWLGDNWYTIVPSAGKSAYQALMDKRPFIVTTLSKKSVVWTMSDTQELADLAREWGYLWHGHVPFASLRAHSSLESSGGTSSAGRSLGSNSGGKSWDTGGKTSGGKSGAGGKGWDK